MLNPKIHITISGAVGSGRSLIARQILDLFWDTPFEGLVPVIEEGDHYFAGRQPHDDTKLLKFTEGSLLEAVGDNPILLISVRPNGQQNQNPQP